MAAEIMNVAVVGCGIGEEHITNGYLPNPDKFRILALCDLNETLLGELAERFAVPRRTVNFDDLLAMDDIDVIDICTPPGLHRDQILKALAAGKHVIAEKPLVGSLKLMDEVIEAERAAPGRVLPVFQYRFGNGIAQAKRIIDAGLAGKPYMATAETFWSRGPDYYASPWHGRWATELGGTVIGHAIHIHDMLFYLMGKPATLFGRMATRVNDIEVEDCFSASLLLESGTPVSLSGTLGSHEQMSRLRLAFENVSFESDHEAYAPGVGLWRIMPANDAVAERIATLLDDWQDVPPGYATMFSRFHDALFDGGEMPVTTEEARSALEIATAFYHSAETGTDVHLPIGPDHPKYESWIPAAFRP